MSDYQEMRLTIAIFTVGTALVDSPVVRVLFAAVVALNVLGLVLGWVGERLEARR